MDLNSDENQSSKPSTDRFMPGVDIRKYVENRIELLSITMAEQIANGISSSIQKFIGLLFLSFGVVFLWIALGFFLGELLETQSLGFLLAALPLLLVGFMFYNQSIKNIENRIQRDIINKIAINFDEATTSITTHDHDNKNLKEGESS